MDSLGIVYGFLNFIEETFLYIFIPLIVLKLAFKFTIWMR